MEPLTTWTCDRCGRLTRDYTGEESDYGSPWVVWKDSDETPHREYGFQIVHKISCDPGNDAGYTNSADMETFLGERGQAYLFSMVSRGPAEPVKAAGVVDMDEWVDFFRRVQTPWYEEARLAVRNPAVAALARELGSHVFYRSTELEKVANQEAE